mgnify:CR=1 FL=1
MEKPHAPSTDKNREPILAVLQEVFADRHNVLEVGSGTGQHAIFFGEHLPHLRWQTSDRADFLPGKRQGCIKDPPARFQVHHVDAERFAALMSAKGISRDSTIVFYGDQNNWWAAYALWVASLFGHADVRLLDGGRKKWMDEGRPVTTDVPSPARGNYPVTDRDDSVIRAYIAEEGIQPA